jgi:hypothetical protein
MPPNCAGEKVFYMLEWENVKFKLKSVPEVPMVNFLSTKRNPTPSGIEDGSFLRCCLKAKKGAKAATAAGGSK